MENKRKNLSGRVVSTKMSKTVVVAVESTEGVQKITKPDYTDSQAEQEEVETEQGAYSPTHLAPPSNESHADRPARANKIVVV